MSRHFVSVFVCLETYFVQQAERHHFPCIRGESIYIREWPSVGLLPSNGPDWGLTYILDTMRTVKVITGPPTTGNKMNN